MIVEDLTKAATGWFSEDGILAAFAKISRPLAVTMTVAILPVGGFMIGTVTIFDADTAAAMAKNSVAFFNGLPEALYWMVGGIATGYFGAKAIETKSPAPPIGRPSPEAPVQDKPAIVVASDVAFDENAAPATIVGSGDGGVGRPSVAATVQAAIDRRAVLPRPTFGQEADPVTKPATAGETPELQL